MSIIAPSNHNHSIMNAGMGQNTPMITLRTKR